LTGPTTKAREKEIKKDLSVLTLKITEHEDKELICLHLLET
jgi:hypothetical protein